MKAGEGAPEAAETGSVRMTEEGSKAVDFGSITFTEAGTFKYTVKEDENAAKGWTCDTSEKTVTVTVTDNGQGQLEITIQLSGMVQSPTMKSIIRAFSRKKTEAIPISKSSETKAS